MRRSSLSVAAGVTLLWAGTALGTPTPQQSCDYARITAWKVYQSCVDAVVAKDAKGIAFDSWKAFWKCRHAYFKKWTAFQSKASLAGSTCVGARFSDASFVVIDNLTGLYWEKKSDDSSVSDKDNQYSWGSGGFSTGGAFTTFVHFLNNGNPLVNDWRLPTLAELQTLLLDYPCTGGGGGTGCECTGPCVDPLFNNTQSSYYWSDTRYVPDGGRAWVVSFGTGLVIPFIQTDTDYVRAVTAGF
ncbi:MAG: DUF1566 domain-containing protein [Deltaproteobacteria bacterium]|nr:DUF1566 domain-containing protein [Deltaproteobacteria bacterium]